MSPFYALKGDSFKITVTFFTIVGRAITLERKPSKKKQITDTKKDAKRIKSDNLITLKRAIEKSPILEI